jgi:hypothetical protein
MKKGLKLAIVLLAIFAFNIAGIAAQNETGALVTCTGGTTCSGAYFSGYDENNCPIYQCPSCSDGEVKKYACPNGMKVDWCHCSSNAWVCVNSPENACSTHTCLMVACDEGESYFTGRYDKYNCPIYDCPKMECSPGLGSEYICPDGTSVPDCKCSEDGRWVCLTNPSWQCPTPVCPEGCICSGNTISCSVCPAGCTCNNEITSCPVCPNGCTCYNNTISCGPESNLTTTTPAENETTSGGGAAEFCPAGCLCTPNQMVCEGNVTSKGKCAMGCELNETCILPGIRASVNNSKQYCDINSEWKVQKATDETCDNNFECGTNVCINGKCIVSSFIEKILEWFRHLFGG